MKSKPLNQRSHHKIQKNTPSRSSITPKQSRRKLATGPSTSTSSITLESSTSTTSAPKPRYSSTEQQYRIEKEIRLRKQSQNRSDNSTTDISSEEDYYHSSRSSLSDSDTPVHPKRLKHLGVHPPTPKDISMRASKDIERASIDSHRQNPHAALNSVEYSAVTRVAKLDNSNILDPPPHCVAMGVDVTNMLSKKAQMASQYAVQFDPFPNPIPPLCDKPTPRTTTSNGPVTHPINPLDGREEAHRGLHTKRKQLFHAQNSTRQTDNKPSQINHDKKKSIFDDERVYRSFNFLGDATAASWKLHPLDESLYKNHEQYQQAEEFLQQKKATHDRHIAHGINIEDIVEYKTPTSSSENTSSAHKHDIQTTSTQNQKDRHSV